MLINISMRILPVLFFVIVATTAEAQVVTSINPALNSNNDQCRIPSIGSATALNISLEISSGLLDKNCVKIKDARMLNDLGYPKAAIQLMCGDKNIKTAMDIAGTPCEAQVEKSHAK
jgi:hypothetical protein